MLPTPSTSHVPYARVYEPAEDSFLLLDTLSLPAETAFLAAQFPTAAAAAAAGAATPASPTPLVVEIGPGSGVVLAFVTAHAQALFSRRDVLTLGVDVNRFACVATRETVGGAVAEVEVEAKAKAKAGLVGHGEGGGGVEGGEEGKGEGKGKETGMGAGYLLSTVQGDLAAALRPGSVDVLVFNPPYVPTDELPALPPTAAEDKTTKTTYEQDSALLALSYAGGRDGMEVTDRLIEALPGVLSDRGVAYLLLCAQNKPEEVKGRIRGLEGGGRWRAETVGASGKQAGWEKLQIVRIWRA
jgi:release factor glutamine methyltransferase